MRTSTSPPLTVSGLVETVMMSRSLGDLAVAGTDPSVSRPAIKIPAQQRKRRDEFDASFNRTDLGGDHPTVDKDRSHGICPSHRARKNMRYVMR